MPHFLQPARLPPVVVPERAEQAHGIQLLRSIGAAVYVLGTVRRRGDYPGTMQTAGLPDVIAFLPCRTEHGMRQLLFWEVKAEGGRLRPEQIAFQALCGEAKQWHVVGPLDALIAALVSRGYVNAAAFAHRNGGAHV